MTTKTVLTNTARKLAINAVRNANEQATRAMLNTLCELGKVQATTKYGVTTYTATKGYVLCNKTDYAINEMLHVRTNSVSYKCNCVAYGANWLQVNINTATLYCVTKRTFNNNVKRMQAKNERAMRIANGTY